MPEPTRNPFEGSVVVVILGPGFGAALHAVARHHPVWIVTSACNRPHLEAAWARAADPAAAGRITGFPPAAEGREDEHFAAYLDTIDMHHGPSGEGPPCDMHHGPLGESPPSDVHHGPSGEGPPCLVLRVIGRGPTAAVRHALADYGFERIEAIPGGFVAYRARTFRSGR